MSSNNSTTQPNNSTTQPNDSTTQPNQSSFDLDLFKQRADILVELPKHIHTLVQSLRKNSSAVGPARGFATDCYVGLAAIGFGIDTLERMLEDLKTFRWNNKDCSDALQQVLDDVKFARENPPLDADVIYEDEPKESVTFSSTKENVTIASQPTTRKRKKSEEDVSPPSKKSKPNSVSSTISAQVEAVKSLSKISHWCFCGKHFDTSDDSSSHLVGCSLLQKLREVNFCFCCIEGKTFCDPLHTCKEIVSALRFCNNLLNSLVVDDTLVFGRFGESYNNNWPTSPENVGAFIDTSIIDIPKFRPKRPHFSSAARKCFGCLNPMGTNNASGPVKNFQHATSCTNFQNVAGHIFFFSYAVRASRKGVDFPILESQAKKLKAILRQRE